MRRMSSSSTTTSTPSTSSKNEDESIAKWRKYIHRSVLCNRKTSKDALVGLLRRDRSRLSLTHRTVLRASLDMPSKIVLAGSMSSIGAFTTIMLHWFVSPYIRRLWVDSETKTKVTAEKTSLLLQTYYSNFDGKI